MNKRLPFEVLADGSLVLTLDEACIQSTAKHAHRELTIALLEGRVASPAMEVPLNLLERFLTTTDFAALRTEHPELAGHNPCCVRLYGYDGSAVRWEVVS